MSNSLVSISKFFCTSVFFKLSTFYFFLFISNAFAATFDFSTATDNGANATETVSSITLTVTSSTTAVGVVNDSATAGTTGNVAIADDSLGSPSSLTLSFSSAVDLTSVRAYDYDLTNTTNWTFTPNVGSNVVASVDGSNGTTVDLSSLTGVTSVTITSAAQVNFGIDDLVWTLANTTPTISISGTTLAYTENSAATQIDSAATTSDSDGDSDWNGGTLTAQITANSEAGDEISISDTDGDGIAITISGTNIFSNGTDVGDLSVSGGLVTGGTMLTITFDGDATNSTVQEILQSLRYRSTSNDPGTSNRIITLEVTDTNSANANDTRTVSITSVNDEPTLTATGNNPTFSEGGSGAVPFSSASASTIESGQTISAFTMTVTNVNDGSSENLLVDGTWITLTHGTSGTTATNSLSYSVSVSGTTATVSLSGGTLSTSATQTLINGINYSNSSDDPNTSNRVLTITSMQDSGGTANGGDDTVVLSIASTITVVTVNDEPTLTATGSNPTFTEGGAASSLFSSASASTVESGQTLSSLTLTVTNVNNASFERLNADGTAITLTHGTSGTTATNSLSYSVSVSGITATVSFSGGTLSTASLQTLVNALSYQNNSNDPNTSNRVVTITSLQDSGGTANSGDDTAALSIASTVTMTGVNDEPTLTATGTNPTFSQGGSAVAVYSTASASTIESGQTISALTMTVTNVNDGSNERLNIDGTSVVLTHGTSGTTASNSLSYSVSVSGTTATVSLSGGTLSTAATQTLINGISYQNNSGSPNTSNRVVTLTSIQDSGGTANGGDDTASLSIASTVAISVPDSDGNLSAGTTVSEPVALNYSVDTVGEAVNLFDFNLSDGATGDGLAMTISQIVVNVTGTASDADRAKVTWRLNGPDASNVTGTYNAGSDTITFTGLSISIANGGNEDYVINGYYNDNTGLTHGQTIILSVDGDTDLTVGSSGTQMGATSAVTNATGTVITDNISPIVTSVTVPANSTYTASANLDFTVNFDENVTVNTSGGTPRLSITVGITGRYANYLSGSGSSALVFRHTVINGDEDLNGIALGSNISPNSGTLRDSAGNDINTTLNSVGSLASVFIDALAPTVTETTSVVSPSTDSTPNVTINTTQAGTLAIGGSCGSGNEGAIGSGASTITLTQPDNSTALASGTYSDCTATVTDAAGNASNILTLTAFTIDVTDPTVDTNLGRTLDEDATGVLIGNTALSSSDNISSATNVTYTLVTTTSNGTLKKGSTALSATDTFTQADIDSNSLNYDHDGTETTSDSFTFTVADGAGNVNDNGSANFTFNMTITAQNDNPTLIGLISDASFIEDTIGNFDLSASTFDDVDAGANNVSLILNASQGTLTAASTGGVTVTGSGSGSLTLSGSVANIDTYLNTASNIQYLGAQDDFGNDTALVTISANDGGNTGNGGGTNVTLGTVNIDITGENDSPTITGIPTTSLLEDEAYSFVPSADDVDGDSLSFSITNKPSWANFNTSNGALTGIPGFDDAGTYNNIGISVSDASLSASLANFSITVGNNNRAPTISGTPATTIVVENAYSFVPTASDPDNDTLTFSITNKPAWANFNTATGELSGVPSNEHVGKTSSIVIRVTDNELSNELNPFDIDVRSNNTVPTAEDIAVILDEDTVKLISLIGADNDNDPLTFTIVSTPGNGELTGEGQNITYTPNPNFYGMDSFKFKVNDGMEDSSDATVTITVEPINDPPVAVNDVISSNNWNSIEIDVLANDSDIDSEQLSIVGASVEAGSVSFNDSLLNYQPEEGFNGDIIIEYRIADTEGEKASAEVLVNISVDVAGLPQITAPPNITVNATGLFTSVDLGVAIASDQEDGALPVSVDSKGVFAPGRNIVVWSTVDSDGNKASASQIVNVVPMVSFEKDQSISEGAKGSIDVILNGKAIQYPVVVNYTVTGTASTDGSDHDLTNGTISIVEGQLNGTIEFSTVADDSVEAMESIILNFETLENAVTGNKSSHTISLVEGNIAPEVSLSAKQNDVMTRIISSSAGVVLVKSLVNDPNIGDTHTYAWNSSDIRLMDIDSEANSFSFEPSILELGSYTIEVSVSDSENTVSQSLTLNVTSTTPTLDPENDSDADGIPDDVEGNGDSDGDGIPDFLDSAVLTRNVIQERGGVGDQFIMETEPGLVLELGEIAFRASNANTLVTQEQIETHGNGGLGAPKDTEFEYYSGLFDFNVENLPQTGQSVNIVIPQQSPIPANAIYRKLMENGWQNFVVDSRNELHSALGLEGYCPPPGDSAYISGLTEGHWCVQLTIEDGGPNDADGLANNSVEDPGGVAVAISTNNRPVANDDSFSTRINTEITLDVTNNDTDEDNDTLTITSANALLGDVVIVGSVINYLPPSDFFGTDTISYSISDGIGGSDNAVALVNVLQNKAPTAVNDSVSVVAGAEIIIDVLANDSDEEGDQITLISANTDQGEVSLTDDNRILYVAPSDTSGNVVINYVIADVFGDESEAIVTVTIIQAQQPQQPVHRSSGGGSIGFLLLFGLWVYYNRFRYRN